MVFKKNSDLDILDFDDFTSEEISNVKQAIEKQECFYGYIPDKGTSFIIKNYQKLSELNCLERSWVTAYVQGSWPDNFNFEIMKAIFDTCRRDVLQELYPLTEDHLPPLERGNYHCISLFRGCASPEYVPGMSWTTNLSKAIWYAAQNRTDESMQECSVYATIVTEEEVYCFLSDNEPEYIVAPQKYWKIDVPQEEFKLDRVRW